jgi:hypothetical protein
MCETQTDCCRVDCIVKVKVKFTSEQASKAQQVNIGYLYSFSNLGARWGGWSTPRTGRFTPGRETRYWFYRRLGGPQGRSGRVRKTTPPPGFDPRTVPWPVTIPSELSRPESRLWWNQFVIELRGRTAALNIRTSEWNNKAIRRFTLLSQNA